MKPMKKKDCETLAQSLRAMGWNPCLGKVMSFDKEEGYKIGVLVEVGDPRLKWVQPKEKATESVTAQKELLNFFSMAHHAVGNRPLHTQPVGFSSHMAGTTMVEVHPGPNESLKMFCEKLRQLSGSQIQFSLFDDPAPVAAQREPSKEEVRQRVEAAVGVVEGFDALYDARELASSEAKLGASMRP